MIVTEFKFDGLFIVEPDIFGDHRGFFTESYNHQQLVREGIDIPFVQDNQSMSVEAGTLRGLHYQLSPKAQTKLVRVLAGSIYDVVIDLRNNSATYGEWAAVVLSSSNHKQLLVPKGFAHGFCTLEPHTQVFYKVDEYYSKECDSGILWSDPDLGIDWPTSRPILSEKDQSLPRLRDAGIRL